VGWQMAQCCLWYLWKHKSSLQATVYERKLLQDGSHSKISLRVTILLQLSVQFKYCNLSFSSVKVFL